MFLIFFVIQGSFKFNAFLAVFCEHGGDYLSEFFNIKYAIEISLPSINLIKILKSYTSLPNITHFGQYLCKDTTCELQLQ